MYMWLSPFDVHLKPYNTVYWLCPQYRIKFIKQIGKFVSVCQMLIIGETAEYMGVRGSFSVFYFLKLKILRSF